MNKPSYNEVRKSFETSNYLLLTTLYKNNKQKLDYICSKGHKHFTTWNYWQQGNRCPYCARNAKLSIEFVKNEFEKENYVLLSDNYINSTIKLDYICSLGHIHSMSWNAWQKKRRCPTCALISRSGENHYFWKNGASLFPYCSIWTKEFKEFIKERDDYKCQNPHCWKRDNVLTIHHIDYNKENCSVKNLITLCRSCNTRANHEQEFYTSLYESLIEDKYGDSQ